VLFYPWSCFLPLAVVLAARRIWNRTAPGATVHALALGLVWLGVWVGGFSLAATKLPNYILPAYPAAALVVAAAAVDAARRAAATGRWPHARWLATGMAALAFGGVATAATILVATRYGLPGAEPAAIVGVVPVLVAAACWRLAARRPEAAVNCFTGGALLYTALAVGPAAATIAAANTIPGFVRGVQGRTGGEARIGTFEMASPNVVFYADGHVNQIIHDDAEAARRFLASGPDTVLLVPAHHMNRIEPVLPAGFGEIGRTRPMFRDWDLVAVGRLPANRTAVRTGAEPQEMTR
jgi:4-amino-4-deoxy-L-arabinose transferase-like glycosyltransferase